MGMDADFAAFVAAAREAAVPLVIVSDGLDYAIASILERHGLGGLTVLANRLVQTGERSWRLAFPHAQPDCRSASGNCKCACARDLGAAGRPAGGARNRVLLIGDGASDFCVAGEVDLVFAKADLLAHCAANGIAHQHVIDFAQALDLLSDLHALI